MAIFNCYVSSPEGTPIPGSGVEEMVTANSLSEKLIQPPGPAKPRRQKGERKLGHGIHGRSMEDIQMIPGLVNLQIAIENGHRNSGFTYYRW